MRLPWRKPPEVDLSGAAFARWIRAQRPPFHWFLQLDEDTQEAFAVIGDELTAEVCVAIGLATVDPHAASAGLDAADNTESEEALLLQMAQRAASNAEPAPSPPTVTMSGVTQRRAGIVEERARKAHKTKSLLGRAPA